MAQDQNKGFRPERTDLLKIPFSLFEVAEDDNTREEGNYNITPEEVDSVRTYGILQPLIGWKNKTSGKYRIVAGHRRYRMMKEIFEQDGIDVKAPFVTLGKEISREEFIGITSITNSGRDHSIFEWAKMATELKELGLNGKQIGDRIAKSEAYVARLLKLLKQPEEFLAIVRNGHISGTEAMVRIRENRIQETIDDFVTGGAGKLKESSGVRSTKQNNTPVVQNQEKEEDILSLNSWKEFKGFAKFAEPKKMSTEKKFSPREVYNLFIRVMNNEVERAEFEKKFKQIED